MALEILNNCCDVKWLRVEVCFCFAGFEIAGLTPSQVYNVAIKTAKTVYVRTFTADIAGVLRIDMDSFPYRVFNRFGGVYELEVNGVTFGAEKYTGYQFTVIDCNDTTFKLLTDTPNE